MGSNVIYEKKHWSLLTIKVCCAYGLKLDEYKLYVDYKYSDFNQTEGATV